MPHKLILHNFTEISEEESRLIIFWRNTDKVKQWMLSTQRIHEEEHRKFLIHLQNTTQKLYFLVTQLQKPIGVICFIHISKESCEIGIYADPFHTGLGSRLLERQLEYAFKILCVTKVVANVFATNSVAIKLYEKYGFKTVSQELYEQKELLCMELKR